MHEIIVNIQKIQPSLFWFIITIFFLASLGCFRNIFHFINIIKIVKNTSVSKIRSAKNGFVKLTGKIYPFHSQTITSPLTNTPCCMYTYKIESEVIIKTQVYDDNSSQFNTKSQITWIEISRGYSDNFFILDDGTDKCIISSCIPEIISKKEKVWYSKKIPDNIKVPLNLLEPKHGIQEIIPQENYRFSEICLKEGDELYALGYFQTYDYTDRNIFSKDKLPASVRQIMSYQNFPQFNLGLNLQDIIDKSNQQWKKICEIEKDASLKKNTSGSTIKINVLSLNLKSDLYILSTEPEITIIKDYYKKVYIGASFGVFFLLLFILGITARFMS